MGPPPRRVVAIVLGAGLVALYAFALIYPLLNEEWEILFVLAQIVPFALWFALVTDLFSRRGKGRVIR